MVPTTNLPYGTILYVLVLFNVNAWKRTEIEDQITMSTETNPDAAAIADMESELRQLRQQNKELRSRLDVVLSTTATSQLPQAVAAREKATSNKAADDEYQLFRTPEHTPKKSQAIKGAAAAAPPEINNIYSVEMTELELLHTHKITPRLTVKKNIDGGGHYARIAAPAQSIGARDEEDPTKTTTANEDDSDSSSGDVFIDDDSHNKHQSRRYNKDNNGSIISASSLIATSHTFPTFKNQIQERAGWLIGLLFFQSCSSFIIANNEKFLQTHMVIVQFLTMLVGAGGNAGNQSAVGVIRGLAVGIINAHTWRDYLKQEAKMAAGLSFLIGLTGFIRAAMFRTPWGETIAITASVSIIVVTSVAIGSTLPLAMKKVGIDPAHSSTTIQVVMDILGVLITVCVSSFVLSFAVFQTESDKSIDDDAVFEVDTANVGG